MHGLPTVLLDVRGRGYTKFFEEPAVLYTAGSVAELTALIREFLVSAGPSPDREAARARYIAANCFVFDGKATERTTRCVRRMISEKAP